MTIPFQHRQSAHCESGVTANLLSHHGLSMSEAMAFGIGSGLFFAYLPFLRVNGLPLTTFRAAPGRIFRRATARLGVAVTSTSFADPARGMAELDRLLAAGIPVGAQTGVYWLPYFPPALRFHFNAHNLVVFGRENGGYWISDPVIGHPAFCPAADLERARFAKGPLAPRGRLYRISRMPLEASDLAPAVRESLREVCRLMTRVPVPLIGVRGIRLLARSLTSWPSRLGPRRAAQCLGQVIRMQEEIGTGGGGFRFMFAAFLQEAASTLGDLRYLALSERMTAIGDRWRDFAVAGARLCKGRSGEGAGYAELASILRDCAERERELYLDIDRVARDVRP